MKRDDLIEALNGITEENLMDGIALADAAAFPVRKRNSRVLRVFLTAGIAVLLAASILVGTLLPKDDPVPPQVESTTASVDSTNGSEDDIWSHMRTPVTVQRFQKNGTEYISFTPTDEMITVCQYMDKSNFVMPEHIPARFSRTDCMPFQSMDNMVNIALANDTIPMWLASYMLFNFEQDENGIALPDPDSLYLPTLPANFYCGYTYMLTGNYRVQIRSHYFTNGLFDAFIDQEEYEESISDAANYLKSNPEISIRNVEKREVSGILQTVTTYVEDNIRYTRVESTFSKNGKNFYTIETYPMPHFGSETDITGNSLYPESLIVYVEQDGLYGWFYLTQFGIQMTIDDISCLGLVAYQSE